jgi:putative hydrolase of the HAD superfamily
VSIEVVAFDADDTLWHSEIHFVRAEAKFVELLSPWASPAETSERLLKMEQSNLGLFGYGMKGFTLSMVETALEVSGGQVSQASISEVIRWGKDMLAHSVELIDDVAETVAAVGEVYRLVLITKGDLSHQESKVARSGLDHHFESVQVVSEKTPATYAAIVTRLGIEPHEFVMVGNSIRSDIEPVLAIGGAAVHVAYEHTWSHEQAELATHDRLWLADGIADVVSILQGPAL